MLVTHMQHVMTLKAAIHVLVLLVSPLITRDEMLTDPWDALILTNVRLKLLAQLVTLAMKTLPVLITPVHTNVLVMMGGPVMDILARTSMNVRTIPTHAIQMRRALIMTVVMNVPVTSTQDSLTVPKPVNVSINVKRPRTLLDAKIFPSQAILDSSMPSHATKMRSASQVRTDLVFPSVLVNTHLDLRFEMASA